MQLFKTTTNIYLTLVSFTGTLLFLFLSISGQTPPVDWITILILAASILLLNHFIIELPPTGNRLSMDSSIFLASLFLFGLKTTLYVLVINAFVFTFSQRKVEWWKHLFNFSIYTLMIVSSYYIYHFTGGEIGKVRITNVIPYISSFGIYFAVNVLLIGIYFFLAEPENLKAVLKGMVTETVATYVCTLLLSLVLVILVDSQDLFGLFLFIGISFLLSLAFKKHFQLFKKVSEKANKDFLTGLKNHGFFKELLEKEVTRSKESDQPLSVSIIDIDDFKKYNDMFGHIEGDHLLQQFGELLKAETEARNYTVARYGGEEFAFMMPNTNKNQAFAFMDTLRKKANDTYFNGVECLPYGCMSFSGGIAESEKETYSISELLNKADQALYVAKNLGKNSVKIFNVYSDYSVQKSLSIERDLDEAEQQLKIFLSKDVYTYRHSKRVYQYAVDFSLKLQLSKYERKILILGALVHDIGKIEIPRDILNKKGILDPFEWEVMKKHVTWGKEIISTNKKLEDVIPLVELHHERFDGTGYPYELKGKTIPKLSRILCVVDSFDAMTTERPYQKTKTFEEAFTELRACSGKQFDPQYVEPFIEMIQQSGNFNTFESELATNI